MRGSLRAFVLLAVVLAACTPVATVPSTPPAQAPTPTTAATADVAGVRSAAPSPSERADGPIPDGFRIAIPRLGIDLPIAEGDVQRDVRELRTPDGYAFHLPGTALPGRKGNTYLYAHARSGMFLALWNARPGDEVTVTTPDGRLLVYVVGEVLPRVPATDVSATLPTTSERLTLQTSTGPSPSDPRFVVLAFPRR